MAGYNNNDDLNQQINQSSWGNYYEQITEQIRSQYSGPVNPWYNAGTLGLGGFLNQDENANMRRNFIQQLNLSPQQLNGYKGYLQQRVQNDSWFDSNTEDFFQDISKSVSAIQQKQHSFQRSQSNKYETMSNDEFAAIVDRIDDETSFFNSAEKAQTIKRILSEQGFDDQDKERFAEYLNQRIEDDGWFDGNTADFYKDILKQTLSIKKEEFYQKERDDAKQTAAEGGLTQRQKELKFEEQAVKDKEKFAKNYEKVQKEYDDYYNKTEDAQNQQHQAIDTAQQQMIKDYGLSNNLVDQSIGQAQEYANSPSVVNQAVQANLADNTRNDILQRQANRSRYGSGLSDPNQRQMDDRLGFAKQTAAMRADEQQGRMAHLQGALTQGANQKAAIADNKHSGSLSGINSKNRLQGILGNSLASKSKLALGGMQSKYAANQMADNEGLRRMQYLEGQQFRKGEPLREASRKIFASDQQKTGIIAGLGGAGIAAAGAFIDNEALTKAGGAVASYGLGAFNSGLQNKVNAGKRTPGYFGTRDSGYVPQNNFSGSPVPYPLLDQEAGNSIGSGLLSLVPLSAKAKAKRAAKEAKKVADQSPTKAKTVTDKG